MRLWPLVLMPMMLGATPPPSEPVLPNNREEAAHICRFAAALGRPGETYLSQAIVGDVLYYALQEATARRLPNQMIMQAAQALDQKKPANMAAIEAAPEKWRAACAATFPAVLPRNTKVARLAPFDESMRCLGNISFLRGFGSAFWGGYIDNDSYDRLNPLARAYTPMPNAIQMRLMSLERHYQTQIPDSLLQQRKVTEKDLEKLFDDVIAEVVNVGNPSTIVETCRDRAVEVVCAPSADKKQCAWNFDNGDPQPAGSPASAAVDPVKASQNLLETAIRTYWMQTPYPDTIYFTPELRAIADPKREAESAMVGRYGNIVSISFEGKSGDFRVFRIRHKNALVEWKIIDDGQTISALTWRVI